MGHNTFRHGFILGNSALMDALVFVVGVILAGLMLMTLIGAIYANRAALPVVGTVFGALILFGLFW